ncbi:hypothetical protein BX600DRAFT_515083 [Xylariales sp. PMI_506]|nr:hypothetical protein BX600DRAFT_515083 [Xylariales sp. PMI_506]
MPRITGLPVELVASILRKLDNIRDLPPSLLTCKHFYHSVSENPGIAQDILTRQIHPALLPYTVAVYEASRLARPCTPASARELLHLLYDEPAQLEARINTMRLADLVGLGYLNDIIQTLATDFMGQAWSCLSQDDLSLSVSPGIFNFVSQDIEFGEVSVDYITNGGENYWKQKWLSQGILFIYRLMNGSSDDIKGAMLKSALASPGARLRDALIAEYGEDVESNVALGEHSDEELKRLIPRNDGHDTDIGPYTAWYDAHTHLPPGAWVMFADNSARRERAYVLWDWGRITAYNLLEKFEDAPELTESQDDFEVIIHSFQERSKIWQQGGWGYWTEGDNSRIKIRVD